MPLDPFALVIAGAFTAGCASIQALAHRAEHVTVVLSALVLRARRRRSRPCSWPGTASPRSRILPAPGWPWP
ncbi:hypothetical protein ACU4GR_02520 [Methylobacterium oryzae CBMB20]